MTSATPYDALINAASSLTGQEILADFDDVGLAVAKAFVDSNREILALAREALHAGCSVPLRYEVSFFAERCSAVPPLRNLSHAFVLELRLAEDKRDFARAVQTGIDLLDLANANRRGGLKIDFLISLALADLGFGRLRRLRDQFDESSRRTLISALDRIERDQEPFAVIAKRDRVWEIAVNYSDEPFDVDQRNCPDPEDSSLSGEDHNAMQCIQSLADLPTDEQNSIYANLDRRSAAFTRLLKIDLALRSYCHAKSAYPDELAALFPDFLDSLPLDPFTDQPFVYRRLSVDSFALYSTGPHKIDHGGAYGHWLVVQAGGADFCLDTNDYPLECCAFNSKPRGIIPRILASIRLAWTHWRVHARFGAA